MKDIREHIKRAGDLGIETETKIEDCIPEEYRDSINPAELSVQFIHDSLVNMGQIMNSYYDAMMLYHKEGIIDEDFFETKFMQDSIFKKLLEIELREKNAFGKGNKDEIEFEFC